MLISTLVDYVDKVWYSNVWQYMLISTLVDKNQVVEILKSDSIC